MSRIEELKKQNPGLNFNLVEFINNMVSKPKYTEMVVNLIKRKNNDNSERADIIKRLESYGIDFISYPEMGYLELLIFFRIVDSCLGSEDIHTLKKFQDLNERNMIENNNLSTYTSFDDLRLQISLSELKDIDKDIEKQIIKLYETPEWIVLKPLSWASSRKYGSNTKWCTSSEFEPEYFYKYARRGILIYAIDKKTGNKIAGYMTTIDYEKELSFWDVLDRRIDSIQANLPNEIMSVFREKLFEKNISTNWDLLSFEEQEKQKYWLEMNGYVLPRVHSREEDDEIRINTDLMNENELQAIDEEVPVVLMRG